MLKHAEKVWFLVHFLLKSFFFFCSLNSKKTQSNVYKPKPIYFHFVVWNPIKIRYFVNYSLYGDSGQIGFQVFFHNVIVSAQCLLELFPIKLIFPQLFSQMVNHVTFHS